MITQEYLKSVLKYDPDWGIFTWLVSFNRKIRIGDIAGRSVDGHIQIQIQGERYYAHRLAWLYMTGEWPKNEVDHKNKIRGNNSWLNLREATINQNKHNRSVYANNKLGVKGVHMKYGRFVAQIKINGKKKHLGMFGTIEEASSAYIEAAKIYHGDFMRII